MTAMLTTPSQIAQFRVAVIIRALDLDVRTGGRMRLSRNVPTVTDLRNQYGITARTKKDALAQMCAIQESYSLVTGA